MNYTYSKHFEEKMKERDINFDDICMLLYGAVDTIKVHSKTDKNAELIMGFVLKKGIVIVVNKLTKNLITVRRMRDNEKEQFRRVNYEY